MNFNFDRSTLTLRRKNSKSNGLGKKQPQTADLDFVQMLPLKIMSLRRTIKH